MSVKDNWQYNEIVTEQDMNQIGQAINKNTADIGDMSTVPTQAKDAAGAITEVNQTLDTHIADYVRQPGFAVTAGTGTAYTLSFNPPLPSLVEGVGAVIKPHVDSGDNPTLNIDDKGTYPIITLDGKAAKLSKDMVYTVRFDGVGNFILQGEGGGGKKFAEGYIQGTGTGDREEFFYWDGSVRNGSYIEVHGLDFTPSIVLAYVLSGSNYITYPIILYPFDISVEENSRILFGNAQLQFGSTSTMLGLKLEGGAYVADGSFRLPTYNSNQYYRYIAIE